jgi:hypothetical protein
MAIRQRPAGPGEPTELIEPPTPPAERPPDRELWPWLLVLLLLVAAGLAAAWFAMRDSGSAPAPETVQTTVTAASAKATPTPAATVTVPDVTGQSVHEAKAELEAAGLEAKTQHVPSTEPKDTVVLQSPGGGAQAQRGDHVLLDVSKGEPRPTRR